MLRPQTAAPDPLEQYGKMISIKSMMGNEQLNEMQRTKAARDLEEEQAFKGLFSGATPEQMNAPEFLQRALGASPARSIALQKSLLENQKSAAELQKTKVDTLKSQATQLRDIVSRVNSDADMGWARQAITELEGPDRATAIFAKDPFFSQPFDAERKKQSMMTGDEHVKQLTPKFEQVDIGGEKKLVDVNPITNPDVKNMSFKKTATPGELMTDTRTRELNGILAGQTSEPSPELVKSIASHEMELKAPPTDARNPIMLDRYGKILAAVKKENPNWSAEQFPTVKKTEGAFATGKEALTVRALSNATGHLDTYERLALAMNNGDTQIVNSIVNKVKQQFGSDTPTNPQAVAQFLSAEIVKAAAGAAGGVSDREHMASIFANKSSPAQMVGAANTVREIMGQQFRSLGQQYESGTYGRKDFADKYLKLPEVRAAYDKAIKGHGGDATPAGGAPQATHSDAPQPKQVSALPDPAGHKGWTATGDDGVAYVSDGKKWVRK